MPNMERSIFILLAGWGGFLAAFNVACATVRLAQGAWCAALVHLALALLAGGALFAVSSLALSGALADRERHPQ